MTTKRLPDGIDQLKSGKYRARYRDGSGQQFSKSFERMSDAKDWRIQQVSGVKAGVHVAPSHVTVSEVAQQWSENRPYRASSRVSR